MKEIFCPQPLKLSVLQMEQVLKKLISAKKNLIITVNTTSFAWA